jgi:hypothetical protein
MRASGAEFDRFITSHLEPLARLNNSSVFREEGALLESAEFESGCLRVRFENDRGALELAISPTHTRRYWAIDAVACLFERIRLSGDGKQRLTLGEQFQLLRDHWTELQSDFRVTNYANTSQLLMQGFKVTPKGTAR